MSEFGRVGEPSWRELLCGWGALYLLRQDSDRRNQSLPQQFLLRLWLAGEIALTMEQLWFSEEYTALSDIVGFAVVPSWLGLCFELRFVQSLDDLMIRPVILEKYYENYSSGLQPERREFTLSLMHYATCGMDLHIRVDQMNPTWFLKGRALFLSSVQVVDYSLSATQVLVIYSTREMVVGCSDTFLRLGASSGLRLVKLFGGSPIDYQIEQLKRNPHIVLATPGRLLDVMEKCSHWLNFSHLKLLVLDELDRCVDMGFAPTLSVILQRINSLANRVQRLVVSDCRILSPSVKEMFSHGNDPYVLEDNDVGRI